MGTLVAKISAESSIGYGVNILEVAPPGVIAGIKTNKVGCVADLPWGPVNTLTDITTAAELFDTFCPAVFEVNDSYAAMKAFLNKTFPGGLKICRIAPTSVAAAKADRDSTAGTGTITIEAKYPGAVGNKIYTQWLAATDADAAKRNLQITIVATSGTTYTALYENLSYTDDFTTVIDDPYVNVSDAAASAMPSTDGSAVALSGGADGTAQASDYVGVYGSSDVGIAKFYGDSVAIGVLFVAECPSGSIVAVNAGLKAYCTANDKGMAVLCTVNGESTSAAITRAAVNRDDRCVMPWPRVNTTNFYDADAEEVEVDGNAFVAAAIAAADPWMSPGGAGSAPALAGITSLENESTSRTTYELLRAAGVAAFFMSTANGGAIIRGAVTTSVTAGFTKIRRRRTADYIEESIAARLEQFAEMPIDLNLSSQSLGSYTGAAFGEITAFLENEKSAGHIADYAVDPYSGNTSTTLAAGRWVILITVQTFSDMDEIVLKANIGDTVTVAAAA